MARKLIIVIILLGAFYGMYAFGTRNASVTLSESLEIAPQSAQPNESIED